MAEATPIEPRLSRLDQLFPTLTHPQLARLGQQGQPRALASGDVLIEAGDHGVPFFIVKSGELEIVRTLDGRETIIGLVGPGQFTGEVNMIAGRLALFQIRARSGGEVIEVERERILALVQTDAELSEILMRAFVLRRVELIAQGLGDAVLIGSAHSPRTLRIKEFLMRNNHPYAYLDLDHDQDVQELLDRFHVRIDEVPVLICRGENVLRNPTNQAIASCLGFNDLIDETHVRDVVIVGAGPSGLAAAVYGASEGLDVLVVEASAPGGQAGTSSRIENYLGFPTGISGQELAGRAYTQAQKFGAQIMIAKPATKLTCERKPYAIRLEDGHQIAARAIVIATGAEYRRPELTNLSKYEGVGVYYGATFIETQLCVGEEVIVVGGGNSAGQAAVFLAETASRVHVLVRSSSLSDSMSRYLIRRIEENPRISLHTHTEITALEGDEHLERVRWRNHRHVSVESHDIRHVFVMTGAVPNTGWLDGCVALDPQGFVKTGADLSPSDLSAARWPLARTPFLLETTLPGVFAVGDVRGGNVKRVASAVGEGSIAISLVHRALQD
jgi:thioredoxin reductase (NADPH)